MKISVVSYLNSAPLVYGIQHSDMLKDIRVTLEVPALGAAKLASGEADLKYFFGSHVATDSGGAASSTAIRALIKQLVSTEDGYKPFSDARIAEILGEQGIVVARRTIAKYRESLSIPPVNLRKSL